MGATQEPENKKWTIFAAGGHGLQDVPWTASLKNCYVYFLPEKIFFYFHITVILVATRCSDFSCLSNRPSFPPSCNDIPYRRADGRT